MIGEAYQNNSSLCVTLNIKEHKTDGISLSRIDADDDEVSIHSLSNQPNQRDNWMILLWMMMTMKWKAQVWMKKN